MDNPQTLKRQITNGHSTISFEDKRHKKLADFYSLFGLTFDYHKHGNSPFHYSASIGQTVLEIYPLTKSQIEADKNLRLGFGIDNFDQTVLALKELQVSFSLEPIQTDLGLWQLFLNLTNEK